MSNPPSDYILIGARVANAARLDWGVGVVERVDPARSGEQPAQRVTVQFQVAGRKTMLVPPARLIPPPAEPGREAGWLESISGRTVDDRLRKLPEEFVQVLGTPKQRLMAVVPLYAYTEEPNSLMKWGRMQTCSADPLSHWSRDELLVAFRAFSLERDAHLRAMAALLKQAEGPEAIREFLASLEEPIRSQVHAALARPI